MQRRALSSKRPPVPPGTPPIAEAEQRDLSPRQHQILDMLRAGKVNKEIARELGIGLGTVKQHVVALFKKLDVSNRAMAVSRGIQSQTQTQSRVDSLQPRAIEGLLEYRPCVVLSVLLHETAPVEEGKRMQQILAAFASEHDALFLARKDHAGDLILGIQRASEQDMFLALRAARTVFSKLAVKGGFASSLKGGLTAGLAVASMHRTGGWSGEAIASIAITQGRDLASRAEPMQLLVGSAARELLCIQNPNAPVAAPESLSFDSLNLMPWNTRGVDKSLLGRSAELELVEALLAEAKANRGVSLHLSGETGMGKSRLCRHVAQRIEAEGGAVHRFACRPDGDTAAPFVSQAGKPVASFEVVQCFSSMPARFPEAVIVDDCHFLPAGELAVLSRHASASVGKLVLLAARRFGEGVAKPTHALRLARLDAGTIEELAATSSDGALAPAKMASIVRRASGVPLFAIELARQRKPDLLPLSLRSLIGARLDGMKLDRVMLRKIARSRAAMDLDKLAHEMNEPRETVQAAAAHALAAGVLNRDDLGRFRFAHPLLRQAIDLGCVE